MDAQVTQDVVLSSGEMVDRLDRNERLKREQDWTMIYLPSIKPACSTSMQPLNLPFHLDRQNRCPVLCGHFDITTDRLGVGVEEGTKHDA